MSGGVIDVTLISASIAPYSSFDSEPCNIYAILKCAGDNQRTNNAEDQGRLPVWNESFSFEIQPEDMSSELVMHIFNVNSDADELLGIGRIPVLDMIGKEEASLCTLINPVQGEIGKVKAVWKWRPGSQMLHKAKTEKESSSVAYPRISKPSVSPSDRLGKLEAVSDALAKLSMERVSGKYSTSYPEYTGTSGKEEKSKKGEYHPYPPSAPVAHPPISETHASGGGASYPYPPPPGYSAYSPEKDAFHTHSSSRYQPPADAYPPNNQGYRHSSSGFGYQPSYQEYPQSFSGSAYPPPPSSAYPPDSALYPPLAAPYSTSKESDHIPYRTSDLPSEGYFYSEQGAGDMDKSGSGKDRGKQHGSYTSYGQQQPSGYPPSSYPPPAAGYSPYNHPQGGGYPPAQHGYPPASHGYPPASHGYPPASYGYPQASQGYPPAAYPPQYPPAHAGTGYLPQGYPASSHGVGHKSDKHGYAAGSYIGHSSSAKTSKKHKEPKHWTSSKYGKAKKQKSFKGMKFKKFKMFKF